MEEVWKDIKGFEGLYMVSNIGNVKRLKSKWVLNERLRGRLVDTEEDILKIQRSSHSTTA
jgi:hypothetical protein